MACVERLSDLEQGFLFSLSAILLAMLCVALIAVIVWRKKRTLHSGSSGSDARAIITLINKSQKFQITVHVLSQTTRVLAA